MGHSAGFSYPLWAIMKDLVKHYGPWHSIWFTNYHSAELHNIFLKLAISFKGTVILNECMYINSINVGLHRTSFKSLVSAKKIWFPAVTHSAVRISNSNNSVKFETKFEINVVK